MASLALTKKEIGCYVTDRDQDRFGKLPIEGYWTHVSFDVILEILRYYDDGSATVTRTGDIELVERNGIPLGLLVSRSGFIPCKAKVVNLD